MEEKFYKVDRTTLLELLEDHLKMQALELGNVSDWEWYADSYDSYLSALCEGSDINPEFVDEGRVDFSDIAKKDIKDFEEI